MDEWISERRKDRVMLTLAVPTLKWTHFTAIELAEKDPNWRVEGNSFCRDLGDNWLSSCTSCALMVPSAANQSDYNVVFNPNHADFHLLFAANDPLNKDSVEIDDRVVSMVDAARRAS